MKKLIFIMLIFMLAIVFEVSSQSNLSNNCRWVDDETEFIVRDKPITIFRATSYIRFYSDIIYRIKNKGTTTLKIIYSSETELELEPGNSIDLTVENADLKIDGNHITKGTGTFRIIYIVKP